MTQRFQGILLDMNWAVSETGTVKVFERMDVVAVL